MNALQEMLASSAAELFASEVTPELLASVDDGVWPHALWSVLEAAEYPQLFAQPDEDVSWADAYPLVAAAGHALAPVPLPETLLASWLLLRLGMDGVEGLLTIVPQRAHEAWQVERQGAERLVSGRAVSVPWAAIAGHLVAVVRDGNTAALAVLPAAKLDIEPGRNVAGEPRDTVTARAVAAVGFAPLGDLPDDVVQRFGALLRATQIAGAVGRILRGSARHASEREQFGRPIGQFQAVSQQLAVLAEEAVAAEVATAAAWTAAAVDPTTQEVAIAKIRAGKAAGIAAQIAHAIHGAIGITSEHSLHFATRRLWSWRSEFGAESHWACELGGSVLRGGGAMLWPSVTRRAT